MVRSWVRSSASGAHHDVTNPWDAVPVSTLACLAGWVLAGLRAVCLLSGRFFCSSSGSYTVVLATLWSACALWGRLRCSPRRCSRMLSLLSSRLVLRLVVAGLSDVAVIVLRPGRARRDVLVRRRGRQWSACPGLCGGPYGPGRPRLIAVGRPLRHLFPVGRVLSWLVRLWRVRV